MEKWSIANIPDQTGKTVIVTGGNSGIGFEMVKLFANKGATVILACRDIRKGDEAGKNIIKATPNGEVSVMHIDLSSLESVKHFANEFTAAHKKLDVLINNAGIMMPPYSKTVDGFESQLGTNYLGHFLLTGLLLPILKSTAGAGVVSLSSLAHAWGAIYFNDLNFEKSYNKLKSYGQSKLACLMFAYELDRRLKTEGIQMHSIAAHPGVSDTSLTRFMPKIFQKLGKPIMQNAAAGALPAIRAAVDTSLKGGEYIGPAGWMEIKGKPVIVDSNALSKDITAAKKLWSVSEELTGIKFL